jgi:ABC-type transport system substrate-binding protein
VAIVFFGYTQCPDVCPTTLAEIADAKKLLGAEGYPDGRDAQTGKPLVLYLDTVARGPGDKARLDWWRKQFAHLSIQLEVRETDWNRFREKLRKGSEQIFILGWNADYPDPENFMFLLY